MERHELKLLQLNFGALAYACIRYAQLNVFLEKHTKPYNIMLFHQARFLFELLGNDFPRFQPKFNIFDF